MCGFSLRFVHGTIALLGVPDVCFVLNEGRYVRFHFLKFEIVFYLWCSACSVSDLWSICFVWYVELACLMHFAFWKVVFVCLHGECLQCVSEWISVSPEFYSVCFLVVSVWVFCEVVFIAKVVNIDKWSVWVFGAPSFVVVKC